VTTDGRAGGVVCVIVTHDRPACLRACLSAVSRQVRPPGTILVIDNGSGDETADVMVEFAHARHLRLEVNAGGAAGFSTGIRAALAHGAEQVWLMDDDGRPENPSCLERLLDRVADGAELVGPLVLDEDRPDRLAFPVRLDGRTVFDAASVVRHGAIRGFAHLFNGALIQARVFVRIGLPDPRFFIRGDEVDFLYRARLAGIRIVLDPAARFLHPGSAAEIHPILFGLFYAVVPASPAKQSYLFRNRAFIFRRYRMWMFLAADVVRYASFFLLNRRGDFCGLLRWMRLTASGLSGRFMQTVALDVVQPAPKP